MKKIISLVLALALLAVPFCGMSFTAAAASGNLITNGTFSDDFNGWTVLDQSEGSTSTGKTTIHPGWEGFNKTAPYACFEDYDAGISQTVALTAGKYALAYKYATTDGASNLIVMVNDGLGGTPLWEANDIHSDGKLVSTVKFFTVTEDLDSARVRFCTEGAARQVIIDDVVLVKIGDNYVADSGFDNGIGADWHIVYGTSSIVAATSDFAEAKGKTGDNCLKIPNWSGGVNQTVYLEANKTYKLEFLIAPRASGEKSNTNVSLETSGGTSLVNKVFSSWNYSYEKVSYIFETTKDEVATLTFGRGDCKSFTVHIDDVSITEFPDEAITNGGFDTSDNWTIYTNWGTSLVTAPDEISGSGNVIKMENYNGGIRQDIQLIAGREYELSFDWAPCSDGKDSQFTLIIYKGGWDNRENADYQLYKNVFKSQDYAFKKFKVAFTATETISATIWFTNSVSDKAATYLDNISLKKMPAERVTNGNFNTTDKWTVYTNWGASHIDATSDYAYTMNKTGDKAIQINNYSGGVLQNINVYAGKTYKLSFLWAPCASGGEKSQMRVTVGDNFGGNYDANLNYLFSKTISSYNYSYEKYTALFTADKTGVVTLRFDRISCDSASKIVLDDVSVKEVKYTAKFASDTITMDDNYIYGAADVDSVLAGFTLSSNATVVCNSDVLKTGAKVTVKVDGAELYSRQIVVFGDVNGDAKCNVLDLVAAKKQAAGMSRLSGAYLKAACSEGDVNAIDLSGIRGMIIA